MTVLHLYKTSDGIVHWSYPMVGLLTVCGKIMSTTGDQPFPKPPPTCLRCMWLVATDKQFGEAW